MGAAFIRKVFENAVIWPNNENPAKQVWFVDIDKFALCIFNRIIYDQEINGPLAASSLLGLPTSYTPQYSLRGINLNTLCHNIASLLFLEGANMKFSYQLVPLNQSKTFPPSIFDKYQWKDSQLAQYCLYDYFKLVSIISNKTSKNILFAKEHPYFPSVNWRFCNITSFKTLMTLFGLLSLKEADENAL